MISQTTVSSHLEKLKTGKASGPDGITNLILKQCRSVLARPLTILFNRSLSRGQVPQEWLQANVVPIFKAGRRDSADNYRPISLSSSLSKVMETLIKDFLLLWLNTSSRLNCSQHGFTANKSCTSQLLEYLNDVTEALDRKLCADSVYLDFSKAFDRVSHSILVTKLHSRGVPLTLVRWIRSFLSNRVQRVVINGAASSWCPVTSGVPQGTVLGPVLFSIFLDDLDTVIPMGVTIKKFADDTKLYIAFKPEDRISICSQLQQTLDSVYSWCNRNLLPLNIKKCSVVHFGRRNPGHDYYVNQSLIDSTVCIKDLGIMLDSNLSFNQHVDYIVSKAQRLLGFVFRTFRSRNPDTLLPVYKSLIRPMLEYATPVWNSPAVRHISTLERVQKRFTKRLAGLREQSYDNRLRCLKLPLLSQRRAFFDLVCMYQILNGLLISKCSIQRKFTSKSLRGHSQMLAKAQCLSECRKRFFTLRIINQWNSLPDNVVRSTTLQMFKARLRNYMKCD